jgi:hypothetical protein
MRLRVISYGVVENHLKLQQPRSKEGLGLIHAAKQTKTLLGKWLVWVLNPDRPLCCRLARALLTRHQRQLAVYHPTYLQVVIGTVMAQSTLSLRWYARRYDQPR